MTDQELLRTWMEMAGGLTQAQAAERLGLTQPGVNQVLKGKCNLSEVGRKFIAHLISDLDTPTPEPLKLITKLWNELWQHKEAQI